MNSRARRFAADWNRPWFGFWEREQEVVGRQIAIEDHADPQWRPADKETLVRYLRTSPAALVGQVQEQPCQICGGLIHPALFLSDGERLWTDSAAHLVEKHDFVLPDRFVATIRSNNYVPPARVDAEAVDRLWLTSA